MRIIRVLTIAFLVAGPLLAEVTWACGESLYRVARSSGERTFTAPIPGHLLVYADSEAQKAMAQQLANSGHGVLLVDSVADLAAELARGGYDVVIAPFGARQAIADAGTSAAYLPVTSGPDENRQARDQYERTVASTGNVKQYLKAIHKTLKKLA